MKLKSHCFKNYHYCLQGPLIMNPKDSYLKCNFYIILSGSQILPFLKSPLIVISSQMKSFSLSHFCHKPSNRIIFPFQIFKRLSFFLTFFLLQMKTTKLIHFPHFCPFFLEYDSYYYILISKTLPEICIWQHQVNFTILPHVISLDLCYQSFKKYFNPLQL